MRLVAEVSSSADNKVRHKAKQLQDLQGRFLAISDTRLISITSHPNYDQHHTMAAFRQFLLHNSRPTPPKYHVFYAVSFLPHWDKIIVRFLPQYRTKADKVISSLVQRLPGIQVGSTIPLTPQQSIQNTTSAPTSPLTPLIQLGPKLDQHVASHLADLNQLFLLTFTVALELPSPGLTLWSFTPCHWIKGHMIAPPSKHRLVWWLQAVLQLLQNTAWDKWRYQIGVLQDWRDSATQAPRNDNQ